MLFAGFSFLSETLIALFIQSAKQETDSSAVKIHPRKLISLMTALTNQIVFAGVVLYGAGYGIFISIIPAFLISEKNFDQTTVGVFFSLLYIALSFSQLLPGSCSDRAGRKPIMIFGLILAAMGIASFSTFELPWPIVLLTLAAFGLGAFYFFWGAGYFSGPLIFGKIGLSEYRQAGFMFFAGLFMIEIIACSIVLKAPLKQSKQKAGKGGNAIETN